MSTKLPNERSTLWRGNWVSVLAAQDIQRLEEFCDRLIGENQNLKEELKGGKKKQKAPKISQRRRKAKS